MKQLKSYIALLVTGILALIIGEANKPSYGISHGYSQFQVVMIAIGVAITVLLILYVIATLIAKRLNRVCK